MTSSDPSLAASSSSRTSGYGTLPVTPACSTDTLCPHAGPAVATLLLQQQRLGGSNSEGLVAEQQQQQLSSSCDTLTNSSRDSLIDGACLESESQFQNDDDFDFPPPPPPPDDDYEHLDVVAPLGDSVDDLLSTKGKKFREKFGGKQRRASTGQYPETVTQNFDYDQLVPAPRIVRGVDGGDYENVAVLQTGANCAMPSGERTELDRVGALQSELTPGALCLFGFSCLQSVCATSHSQSICKEQNEIRRSAILNSTKRRGTDTLRSNICLRLGSFVFHSLVTRAVAVPVFASSELLAPEHSGLLSSFHLVYCCTFAVHLSSAN